jgi:tRNA threonylcarbamoyl adenosine modification protein (Sua5/YciO/YrdC/YwlC family)
MPEVIDWRSAADPFVVIDQAARALGQGQLVAFPTETVYGVAANLWRADAVERLVQTKGRPEDKPMALAVEGAADALDWAPRLSTVGQRLARRCWPGPVTLVCGEGIQEGLASQLPESVRQRVCPEGMIGLRAPAHDAIQQVLGRMPGPLVLTSANRSGLPDAATCEEVVKSVGDALALVIADDACPQGKPSTVVRVEGSSWHVLREGAVDAATLKRLAGCMIVFVCTGNTCRSPLAEALFKMLLSDRLGCQPEELAEHGFLVHSAGLAAYPGCRATPEAVEAARELGADLSEHMSQQLTAKLAIQADYLVAMTQNHLLALTGPSDWLGEKVRLLCSDDDDVPDPIGGDQQTYRECARRILSHLETLLPEVLRR